MTMDQYLYIPFLGGWTSIYQLFWCSPGVQGFDPSPYDSIKSLAVRGFPSLHCESAKNGAGRTALCPAKSGGSHAVTNGVGAKMISTNEYSGIETSNQFGYGGYGGYGSNLWLRFWNYVIATKTSTNFERAAGTKFWKAPVFRLHHISCFFLERIWDLCWETRLSLSSQHISTRSVKRMEYLNTFDLLRCWDMTFLMIPSELLHPLWDVSKAVASLRENGWGQGQKVGSCVRLRKWGLRWAHSYFLYLFFSRNMCVCVYTTWDNMI